MMSYQLPPQEKLFYTGVHLDKRMREMNEGNVSGLDMIHMIHT